MMRSLPRFSFPSPISPIPRSPFEEALVHFSPNIKSHPISRVFSSPHSLLSPISLSRKEERLVDAMVKGKLILICQSGGSFVTNGDGSLTYTGGEANAMNITQETVFDDLKLKLAEVCDLDLISVSVKYFLPGNNRTLINLKSDRDLKRMLDFHANSVTAEIFVSGNPGFGISASTNRATGVKLAETVNHNDSPAEPAAVNNMFEVAVNYASHPAPSARKTRKKLLSVPPADSLVSAEEENSSTESSGQSSDHGSGEDSDYAPRRRAKSGAKADSDCDFDDCGTPAERVKKRRRTTGSNKVESGSGKKRSRKKNKDGALTNVVIEDDLEESRAFVMLSDEDLNGEEDLPEKLVASWKKGITGVGQDFKSVKDFREALQKYAIANRFVYRLKKNDTNRASGRCVIEGCSWRIHASWVHADQTFRIRKFNDEHTCGGESWKSAHPGRNWLVSIIKERIRDSPNEKPREVAKGILRDFGIKLKYTQVWRGIEDAKEQLQGSYRKSYNRLPWFCEKVLETNPGSVTMLMVNEEKRFERLFFSFIAAVHGFQNGCRPLIFLETSSLRSKYKETLLTASAVDADDRFFPVSFAIVDIENDDSWRWFLEQLKTAISTLQPVTFISDREKNLKNLVLEVFENGYHGYSIFHLMESLKKNMKGPFQGDGRGVIPGIFLAAAHAVRLDAFQSFIEQIKQISSTTYDWVIQIEPEHWTTLLFKGIPYNYITHNAAEMYSKLIEDMRGSTIMQKIDALICMLSDQINHRREESSNCFTKLAPSKEKQIRQKAIKAQSLKVLFSSEVVFEVHDDLTHVVNIENQDCTCLEWKLSGLPCCHAVAVFLSSSKSVYDYCPQWFSVESFRSAYSESINLIPGLGKPVEDEVDSETADVLPPSPSPSRFPVQEKEEDTKTIDPNKRTVMCSKCKEPGHNKASCKVSL